MKKVSTVVAKQSRNISQQTLTVGLDLGDRNSWYCVVDEKGQIQLEQRVRTNAKALQEVFGAMRPSRIALEIGTHSPWVSHLLSELGHEVIVANARKVRLMGEIDATVDMKTPPMVTVGNVPAGAYFAPNFSRHEYPSCPFRLAQSIKFVLTYYLDTSNKATIITPPNRLPNRSFLSSEANQQATSVRHMEKVRVK